MHRRTALAAALALAGTGAALVLALHGGSASDPVRADEPAGAATGAPAADPWAKPAAPRRAPRYDRFETLGVADGLPTERTTCVAAEGDDLFVGTEHGLAMRRGGAWRTWTTKDGLPHDYVTSLARDAAADVVWAGTLRGLARVAGGAVDVFTQRTSGLANDVVYHVVLDGPRVWCGTGSGTSILDTRTGSWSSFDHKNSILHEPWSYAVALGPERAWIAIWGGGICELDRRHGTWREYKDPDGEMEIDLLADDGVIHDVSSFAAYADGLLWQTSYFGVSRFDGRRWRTFTAAEGLPGDFVTHVAARGAAAWFSTDQGLGLVDGDRCTSYRRQPDGTCRVRVMEQGREVSVATLATAPGDDSVAWTFPRDGDVWIATSRGLSRGVEAQEQETPR